MEGCNHLQPDTAVTDILETGRAIDDRTFLDVTSCV